MAGRLIQSKKILPLSEENAFKKWSNWYNCSRSSVELQEEVKDDRALERFSDDPPEAGTSQDEPYLFSRCHSNRWFVITHLREERTTEVRSMYRCLEIGWHYIWSQLPQPCNCIILLVSDGKLAIGHYKEGKLAEQHEINAQRNYDGSVKDPRSFLKKISVFVDSWQYQFARSKLVFVRCSQLHYYALFEGLKEQEKKEKYRHIPFVTCPPSIEEVERVHSRLFTYVLHGSLEQTLADLQRERNSWNRMKVTIPEQSRKPTKTQRKSEKQQFPWLDARTATEIREAVGRNDGDRLEELLSEKPTEIRAYLNEPKLDGGTFLHYAVRQQATDSAEVLLEFGADPTVTDGQNKVPFEYSKCAKMEEIFMKFREENEGNFDWNKAKIPMEKIVPVTEEKREEYDKRAVRDKLRSHRRQKLDKRRVKIEY